MAIEALILNPPRRAKTRRTARTRRVVRAYKRVLIPRKRRARVRRTFRPTFVLRPGMTRPRKRRRSAARNVTRAAYRRTAAATSLFSPLISRTRGGMFYRPGANEPFGGTGMVELNVRRRRRGRKRTARRRKGRRVRRNVWRGQPRRHRAAAKRGLARRRAYRVRWNDPDLNPWYDDRAGHRRAARKGWDRRRRGLRVGKRRYRRPTGIRKYFGKYRKYSLWGNPVAGVLGGLRETFSIGTLVEGATIAGGAILSRHLGYRLVDAIGKENAAAWKAGWQGKVAQVATAGLLGALVGSLLKKPVIARGLMLGGMVAVVHDVLAAKIGISGVGPPAVAGVSGMGDALLNAAIDRELARGGIGDYLGVEQVYGAPELGDYMAPADIAVAPELGEVGGEFEEGIDWEQDVGLEF